MRLIYFTGHPSQQNSAMITRVHSGYHTLSTILTGEFATRVLLNLYNLHTVRGLLDKNGELILETSMSGPHEYFGVISPWGHYKITLPVDSAGTITVNVTVTRLSTPPVLTTLIPIPPSVTRRYRWQSGKYLEQSVDVDTGHLYQDSLFDHPGVLTLDQDLTDLPIINGADYDLTGYGAQVLPNTGVYYGGPDGALLHQHYHSRHPLRLITYHYGPRYLFDYLLGLGPESSSDKPSGVFVEKHDFIQSITPTDVHCSGYVILARDCTDVTTTITSTKSESNTRPEFNSGLLEFIGVTIPYGYTLVVNPRCIHGDSTLVGTYLMAMTGNHLAMNTADTVFMKSAGRNVMVPLPVPITKKIYAPALFMTSDQMSLAHLKEQDQRLKLLSKSKSGWPWPFNLLWQPVIFTGVRNSLIGWRKTLGPELP